MYPYSNPSLIAKGLEFIKNIKWNSLLEGTGKTLGVINQAIPIIYQVKPLLGGVKEVLNSSSSTKSNQPIKQASNNKTNSPIFYIE